MDDGKEVSNSINNAIKNAWQAALLSSVLTLVFGLYPWFDGLRGITSFYNLPCIFISLALAYGVYKNSRICAVALLLLFVVSKVFLNGGVVGYPIFIMLFIVFFSRGVAGTFLYHRYYNQQVVNVRMVYISTLVCAVIAFGILVLVNVSISFMVKSNAGKVWGDFSARVNDKKNAESLPVRVDYYTVLTNYYVQEHRLVFQYKVENIDISEVIGPELYKSNLDAFQRFCADPIVTVYGLNVEYSYTQGMVEKSYSYNAKDCTG